MNILSKSLEEMDRVCGTSDLGKNYRLIPDRFDFEIDFSEFYGYSYAGLKKSLPCRIAFYKVHPAKWICSDHKKLWRYANYLNNIARILYLFRSEKYLVKELKLALSRSEAAYIGLHDWLSCSFMTKAQIEQFLKKNFPQEMERILICETDFHGYFLSAPFLEDGRMCFVARFGSYNLEAQYKILGFKRFMSDR